MALGVEATAGAPFASAQVRGDLCGNATSLSGVDAAEPQKMFGHLPKPCYRIPVWRLEEHFRPTRDKPRGGGLLEPRHPRRALPYRAPRGWRCVNHEWTAPASESQSPSAAEEPQ